MKNFEPFVIKVQPKFITASFVLLISYVGNNSSYNGSKQTFKNVQYNFQYINPRHGFSIFVFILFITLTMIIQTIGAKYRTRRG